jgi:glucokinase
MSQSPVVLGLDYGGTKIAAAVCDLAGQRLASVFMPSCGELGARDSFVHGIDPAWDLLRTAAPGAELGGARTHATATPSARRRSPLSLPLRRAGQPDRAPRRTHP